jgi:hypothetical protein
MTRTTSGPTKQRGSNDERLNEEFHTLLRDAAQKREGRALVQSTEDAAAAKQESADLLALARGGARARDTADARGHARASRN